MRRDRQHRSQRNCIGWATLRVGLSSALAFGFAVVLLGTMSGCGSENVFEILEQPDSRSKGETALSRGDYDEAIQNLEAALEADPNDVEARKMLATAYMAKSGLDTFSIVQSLATAGDDSDWPALVDSMPDGSAETRENLAKAIETLSAIPAQQRTDEERYQLAMVQTGLAVSTAKKYGVDDSGQVSEEQANQITNEDAEIVLEQLSGAAENLDGLSDPNAGEAGEKIGTFTERIQGSEGATPAQRLQSFLAAERN